MTARGRALDQGGGRSGLDAATQAPAHLPQHLTRDLVGVVAAGQAHSRSARAGLLERLGGLLQPDAQQDQVGPVLSMEERTSSAALAMTSSLDRVGSSCSATRPRSGSSPVTCRAATATPSRRYAPRRSDREPARPRAGHLLEGAECRPRVLAEVVATAQVLQRLDERAVSTRGPHSRQRARSRRSTAGPPPGGRRRPHAGRGSAAS